MGAVINPANSALHNAWQSYCRSRFACMGLVIFLLCSGLAVFAPWLTPQNPFLQASLNLADSRLPPWTTGTCGYIHIFGTDADGRDLYSAIVYGLRTSMTIGIISGAVALAIGVVFGLFAGFLGGRAGGFIMRLVDLQLSFPPLMLALALVAAFGQGEMQVIIALVTAQYAYFARTIHGTILAESRKGYIEAAVATPLPLRRILFCHLLPNVLPSLVVVATAQIASAIMMEATLSFLGVGLPVTEPSLGGLIYRGFEYMQSGRYWMSFYPGLALIILVLSINLIGDRLRDMLNPRMMK